MFFTHFHGDHVIGVIGLLRTLALQGRTEPMRLFGPRGAARVLSGASAVRRRPRGLPGGDHGGGPGQRIVRDGYSIIPFATVDHGAATSLGYTLVEEGRKGRFDPDLARELGIPEGPLWGKIHRARAVTLDDGRVVEPSDARRAAPRRAARW